MFAQLNKQKDIINKDNNNAKEAGQEFVFSKAHNVHERHLFHKKVNLFDEMTIDDALDGEPGDEWDQAPDGNGGEYLSPRESFLYYRASRDVMSLEKTKQIVRMTRYGFETGWALLKQVEDHICYQNAEKKEEYLRYARFLFRALNGVQARFSLFYNYFVKKKM